MKISFKSLIVRNPINLFEIYSFVDETIGIKRNRTVRIYLNDKMINKFNSYINFCLRDNINKTKYQTYQKPKISVIIPIYKCTKLFKLFIKFNTKPKNERY